MGSGKGGRPSASIGKRAFRLVQTCVLVPVEPLGDVGIGPPFCRACAPQHVQYKVGQSGGPIFSVHHACNFAEKADVRHAVMGLFDSSDDFSEVLHGDGF